jgi:hypothetical protein
MFIMLYSLAIALKEQTNHYNLPGIYVIYLPELYLFIRDSLVRYSDLSGK